MDYKEIFKAHYAEWLADFDDARLVEVIENLEQLIDSDIFRELLLGDEVTILYDIARDECVERVRKSAIAGIPTGERATRLG